MSSTGCDRHTYRSTFHDKHNPISLTLFFCLHRQTTPHFHHTIPPKKVEEYRFLPKGIRQKINFTLKKIAYQPQLSKYWN